MVGAHPVSQLMWLASANRCAPVTHLDQSERRTRYRVKAPALARESRQKVLGTRRRSYEAHCVRAHRLATSQPLVDSATRSNLQPCRGQPGRVIIQMVLNQTAFRPTQGA